MKTKKELDVIYYNYVLECIPDIETLKNEFGVICANDTERLQYLIDMLNRQINYEYNKRRFPSLVERIADNLQGLPSYFNLEVYNYGILCLLYQWQVIPAIEQSRLKERTENAYIENWFKFWANYILKVAKKHKININILY